MRSHPGLFHLSFLLPKGIIADSGSHAPFDTGCSIRVLPPLVKISGPSREAVFEHATQLLRVRCRGHGALSIAATLVSPLPVSGSDSWSIIVGAEIAFSPTSLNPHFPLSATGRRDASPSA